MVGHYLTQAELHEIQNTIQETIHYDYLKRLNDKIVLLNSLGFIPESINLRNP